MQVYDIIGALRTLATTNGWAFLSGSSSMQNYEASQNEYINGQLVLIAEFNARPIMTRAGKLDSIRYNGVVGLGIKFDDDGTDNIEDDPETPENETKTFNDGTPSSLDETFIQKYDRRLLTLMQTLSTNLLSFACANELTIVDADFRLELNKFDTNIDFVIGTITFEQ